MCRWAQVEAHFVVPISRPGCSQFHPKGRSLGRALACDETDELKRAIILEVGEEDSKLTGSCSREMEIGNVRGTSRTSKLNEEMDGTDVREAVQD